MSTVAPAGRVDPSIVAKARSACGGKPHLGPLHAARTKPAREPAKNSHTMGRNSGSLHSEQIGHNCLHSFNQRRIYSGDGRRRM
jgi:hypothetical protein